MKPVEELTLDKTNCFDIVLKVVEIHMGVLEGLSMV
jgi:hypothetical protein